MKIKSYIIGILAVLCQVIAIILAIISFDFAIKKIGTIICLLMILCMCLRDKYKELRCKEIDEEINK